MKPLLIAGLLLIPLPAYAQGMCGECLSPNCRMMMCPDGEGDNRPSYCHSEYSGVRCDRNGNIMRYHTPDSPYRQGPVHHNRYGEDD